MTINQLIKLLQEVKKQIKYNDVKIVLWNSSNPLIDIELSDRNLIEGAKLVSLNGTKMELEVENRKT
jgi:uncharacterized phosphosugar-binding protein